MKGREKRKRKLKAKEFLKKQQRRERDCVFFSVSFFFSFFVVSFFVFFVLFTFFSLESIDIWFSCLKSRLLRHPVILSYKSNLWRTLCLTVHPLYAMPGQCLVDKEAPNTFTCRCPGDLLGMRCTYGPNCRPNPCLHGGTCVEGPTSALCHCAPGFAGKTEGWTGIFQLRLCWINLTEYLI